MYHVDDEQYQFLPVESKSENIEFKLDILQLRFRLDKLMNGYGDNMIIDLILYSVLVIFNRRSA